LGKIAQAHQELFGAIARFIEAGNKVVFISGNHDAELYWDEVRAELIKVFSSYIEGRTQDDFTASVEFKPWADYEPGLYWIEHGSQYESYNSFWDPIHPKDPKRPGYIQYQFAVLALYYFANHMTKFTEHFIGIWKYFYTLFKGYGPGAPLVLFRYFRMVWKIVIRHKEFSQPPPERDRNLKSFATSLGIDQVKLDAVAHLWREPVMAKFSSLIRASYFDKFLLVLAGLVAFAIVIFGPWEPGTKVAICLILGIVFYAVISALHTESLSSVYEYCRHTAGEISQLLSVPFVIFGHNHHPVHYDIPGPEEAGWYINVGAWTDRTSGKDDHEGAVKTMPRFTYFRCIEETPGELNTELLHFG
jgi:hypothetical protein